jgi:Siphovirus Gp157
MNNLSLYELSNNYLHVLEALTDPEADLPIEVVNDTLEALSGEMEDKAINVAKFLRNLEVMAESIKQAEMDMAKRRKAIENRVQWFKSYLKISMENTRISKIECPYFKLSIQSNPVAVEILNESVIPRKFKEKVIAWKIDKNAIKEALKAGKTVKGAALVNGSRLVIK